MIYSMPLEVLVVDDDPWFRTVARRLLESAGFDVVGEAESATEARAAVARLGPAAVLLDVSLPDGDGVSLAGELAALPSRPLILLTSSDPDAVTGELAQRSGAEGFVPKQDLSHARLHAAFVTT
jgi:DNA-binding NarL/FixJ family response regulator